MQQITHASNFSAVVADWQRCLLQLDRRNNSLYFRRTAAATLIADQAPDQLVRRLELARQGLKFDYAEPLPRRRGGFGSADEVAPELTEPPVARGDLRSDCSTTELQRKLGNLRRRARQWEEEQGLSVLFLALGFLRWIDEDGQEALSPLLLLPVRLETTGVRSPFILFEHDDDLTENHTLAVKLKSEFGLDLPDFVGPNPSDYFSVVGRLIGSRPGWQVQPTIYLSTFSCSKLAMWSDLEQIRRDGTSHPIVRALAGATEDRVPQTLSPAASLLGDMTRQAGGGLDDILDVRDEYAVLPTDYSQLVAIAAARLRESLVIHGPPGTGKSQTIANIIATMIAMGLRVLFVSEKTAALDVVHRRLAECRLDIFALDLHSERGSKTNVYGQLRRSMDDPKSVTALKYDYDSLINARNDLNRFVRALHASRSLSE